MNVNLKRGVKITMKFMIQKINFLLYNTSIFLVSMLLMSCSSKPLSLIETVQEVAIQSPIKINFSGIQYMEKAYWNVTDSKRLTIPAEYDSIFNYSIIKALNVQPNVTAILCNDCDEVYDLRLDIELDQYGLNDKGTIMTGTISLRDAFGSQVDENPFEYREWARPSRNANTNAAIEKVIGLTLTTLEGIDYSFMDRVKLLASYKEKDYMTFKTLVDSDVKLTPVDNQGSSILHFIANDNDSTALAIVRDINGLDVNSATKKEGITPLMVASHRWNAEMVNWLLQSGADPSLNNGKGLQAIDYLADRLKNDLMGSFMRGFRGDFFSKEDFLEHAEFDPEIMGFYELIEADIMILKALVNAGVEVHEDTHGYEALNSVATWFEDDKILKKLLKLVEK